MVPYLTQQSQMAIFLPNQLFTRDFNKGKGGKNGPASQWRSSRRANHCKILKPLGKHT